ncbi:MAG: hypothetical protein VB055_10485 [Oscillospiraceae bacterium]|nr:hypothetical protein [Oscillospiraceae bacterium]
MEGFFALLATLGKLYFVVILRNADPFEIFSVRLLWEQLVINPMLLFLYPALLCQWITKSWKQPASKLGEILSACCLFIFLLYFLLMILLRSGALPSFYSVLMLFLNHLWIFVALGFLHTLFPLLQVRHSK